MVALRDSDLSSFLSHQLDCPLCLAITFIYNLSFTKLIRNQFNLRLSKNRNPFQSPRSTHTLLQTTFSARKELKTKLKMPSMIRSAAGLLAAASTVFAHGHVTGIVADGV